MALKAERIGTSRAAQPMGGMAASYVLTDDALSRDPERGGWELNPSFQRGSVWTLKQKRAWIESILMGIGLPAIIVNRFPSDVCPHPKYGWREIVIDGQQRLRATAEFMQDKFQVRGEKWSEQSLPFQRNFRSMAGLAPVIYCGYRTERECAELYLKLLQAGTAHTDEEIKKAKRFIRKNK
jgi:hypothetical protein